MSIVVTGATGMLGRLVIEGLLAKVPGELVAAVVRDQGKAADLAARGLRITVADYNSPETFDGLFSTGDKVLLISSNEEGKDHVAQHTVVVDAAKAAGVALLAFTSATGVQENEFAAEYRETEKTLVESGLPYVLLRNNWYSEAFAQQLAQAMDHGTIIHAAGEGRIASATRADYAAAAVAVLTGDGHHNKTYELGGDQAWNFAEYAAEIGRQTGKAVVYQPITPDAYTNMMTNTGLPEQYARIMAVSAELIAQGQLAATTGELSRLIGRPTTPIADTIAAGLKALEHK